MTPRRPRHGDDAIPTLTDVVELGVAALSPEARAALQADITARVLKVAEELLQEAGREVQAVLLERVSERLRARLPELIEAALRERG